MFSSFLMYLISSNTM